jgi:hypothetical protein
MGMLLRDMGRAMRLASGDRADSAVRWCDDCYHNLIARMCTTGRWCTKSGFPKNCTIRYRELSEARYLCV